MVTLTDKYLLENMIDKNFLRVSIELVFEVFPDFDPCIENIKIILHLFALLQVN